MDAIMQPMFYFPFLENKEGNRYESCPHLASNFFGTKQAHRAKKICFISLYKPLQSSESPAERQRVLGWLNISGWPRRMENTQIFNQHTKQDWSDSLTDDLNPWCHQSLWFVVFKTERGKEKRRRPTSADSVTKWLSVVDTTCRCTSKFAPVSPPYYSSLLLLLLFHTWKLHLSVFHQSWDLEQSQKLVLGAFSESQTWDNFPLSLPLDSTCVPRCESSPRVCVYSAFIVPKGGNKDECWERDGAETAAPHSHLSHQRYQPSWWRTN